MANTTNLDLVKPAGTDHALISVLNSNSDKIDAFAGQTNDSLSAEQNGLAYIVGNTNTTGGTLVVGQFVYVKGHSTIAEGLRKVTASISANASITTSNTDACSEGGLNALNSKLTTNKYDLSSAFSDITDFEYFQCMLFRSGNVVTFKISGHIKATITASTSSIVKHGVIPTGYRPTSIDQYGSLVFRYQDTADSVSITSAGDLNIDNILKQEHADRWFGCTITYVVEE